MKYRKKPVVIDAVQYAGNNFAEILQFTENQVYVKNENSNRAVYVPTLEGDMRVSVGDFVIRGIGGEYYPCKPDIFELTYEPCNQ